MAVTHRNLTGGTMMDGSNIISPQFFAINQPVRRHEISGAPTGSNAARK
jgi:hypothetical protein